MDQRKLSFCLLLLCGVCLFASCANGPVWRAREFSRNLEKRDAARTVNMLENAEQVANSDAVAQAVRSGLAGAVPVNSEWDRAKTVTRVDVGSETYMLARVGENWKIRCATVGPFHDQTPEMTLLLAMHLIESGRFEDLRKLIPQNAASGGAFSPEFRKELAAWAKELHPQRCKPFDIEGSRAMLRYGEGERKALRLVREREGWRIVELW